MQIERAIESVPLELIEKLDVTQDDDPGKALRGALTIVESLDPRKYVAFTAYYGLCGFAATSTGDIALGMGVCDTAIDAMIEHVESFIDEELCRLRLERSFPEDYDSWPSDGFFTVARGLQCRVHIASATRIRNLIRKERIDFPTVGLFRTHTESGLLLIPEVGPAMVRGIKMMLSSVRRTLATH